jgi:hypothetical protein
MFHICDEDGDCRHLPCERGQAIFDEKNAASEHRRDVCEAALAGIADPEAAIKEREAAIFALRGIAEWTADPAGVIDFARRALALLSPK